MLTRRAGVWRAVGRGGAAGRCRKIANRGGVEGLLCLTDHTQHGDTTFWLSFGYVGTGKVTVFTIDEARQFRQLADGRGQQLLEVSDYRNEACYGAIRGISPIVPVSEILAIEVNQTKSNTTLLVRVSCSRGMLTAQWRKRCAAHESELEDLRVDAIERTFELRYTFDGDMFVLNKASQAAKRQLETCAALPRR
ncbi:MAG: hypothetical protein JNL98_34285 [Bryobacterales bacterium]|nr:hypothetical protein [Bryobacterales bacterium]